MAHHISIGTHTWTVVGTTEHTKDLATCLGGEKDGCIKIFPMEGVGHTKHELRSRLAEEGFVVGSKVSTVVNVAVTDITWMNFLAFEGNGSTIVGCTISIDFCLVLPHANSIIHIESVDRFAHHQHVRVVATLET